MLEDSFSFEKFRDDGFLAAQTLTTGNVLEYFYSSRFFDVTSLNQQRRKGHPVHADADGIEYVLVFSNSAARDAVPLAPEWGSINMPNNFGTFVIQKLRREKGNTSPMECYYILGGTIYKAPTAAAVVRHRLVSAVHSISRALDDLEGLCHWSLAGGYSWDAAMSADEEPATTDGGLEIVYSHPPSERVERALESEFQALVSESEVYLRQCMQLHAHNWMLPVHAIARTCKKMHARVHRLAAFARHVTAGGDLPTATPDA